MLAVVDSNEKQNAIAALVTFNGQSYWIGLYGDPENASLWRWVDWSRLCYGCGHWDEGEPNNYGGRFEGCVEMQSYGRGFWNDLPCSRKLRYICQKKGGYTPSLTNLSLDLTLHMTGKIVLLRLIVCGQAHAFAISLFFPHFISIYSFKYTAINNRSPLTPPLQFEKSLEYLHTPVKLFFPHKKYLIRLIIFGCLNYPVKF